MNRNEALQLLKQNIKNDNLIKHSLAAEALMTGLAQRFGQDTEKWGLAGLLHDLDWEKTKDNPDKHSLLTCEILEDFDIDSEIVEAIKTHNPRHQLEPKGLLAKALYSAEEITGLVTAAALVQPDKKLSKLSTDSVMRKFKTKSFAAGVDREIVSLVEPWLGITIEELIDICLRQMREISEEIGL